jgi:hypothetical protein
MSEAPRARPVPVGQLVAAHFRPQPPAGGPPAAGTRARWAPAALALAALCPLLLASAGLLAVALRPVPQTVTESAYRPPVAAPDEAEPWWLAAEEAEPVAARVEPGEARPLSTDLPAVPAEPVPPEPAGPARSERLGTAIDFVWSPTVAFARAEREQKLVMVLHLAGNFEDCGFT